MLAGAHGIDVALLVVAADESVMPQTREHFEICRLLGIPRGLVALTKCDLADAEMQAAAELEVRELVKGSFLDARPILRVAAVVGEGLDALRGALLELAREAPPRSSEGLLRLPVDRVFSAKGFGTVVTGTLVAGDLRVGEELELLPSGKRARVRGLQVHAAPVDRATAGMRTAVNLAGIDLGDVARGDVLTRPGTLRATSMVDVDLSLLATARPLSDGARVRVHVASAEALARVALLGRKSLVPGTKGVAQLRLETRVVAGRGDRLVLRSYSPVETIGGALVLDPLPPRRTAATRGRVERLREPALGSVAEVLVEEAKAAGIPAPLLAARLAVPLQALLAALAGHASLVVLGSDPAVIVSPIVLAALEKRALEVLAAFHAGQTLRPGMPREELRARAFAGAAPVAFDHVVTELAAAGRIRVLPDAIALAGHEVRLSAAEEEARSLLLERARAARFSGVETAALAADAGRDPKLLERMTRMLVSERALVRIGETLLLTPEHLEALKQEVRRRWSTGSKLDVAAFKEMTGLSRKYAIPLLEYLDRQRVTRRSGNDRVVL